MLTYHNLWIECHCNLSKSLNTHVSVPRRFLCVLQIFWISCCNSTYKQEDNIWVVMMTSSNGNIFRVTGHLYGEFTGPLWIPAQRPVTRCFDVFCVWINGWVNSREACDFRHHRSYYDITVMTVSLAGVVSSVNNYTATNYSNQQRIVINC